MPLSRNDGGVHRVIDLLDTSSHSSASLGVGLGGLSGREPNPEESPTVRERRADPIDLDSTASDAFKSIFSEFGSQKENSQPIDVPLCESDVEIMHDPATQKVKEAYCTGIRGTPCVFSTENPGGPVVYKRSRCKCDICDPLLIQKLMNRDIREDNFRKGVKKLSDVWQDLVQKRLPELLKIGDPRQRRMPCAGYRGEPCRFSHVKLGRPALAPYGWQRCAFCQDTEELIISSVNETLCASIIYSKLRQEERALLQERFSERCMRKVMAHVRLCIGRGDSAQCIFADDNSGNPCAVEGDTARCIICAPKLAEQPDNKTKEAKIRAKYVKLDNVRKTIVRGIFPELNLPEENRLKRRRIEGAYCVGSNNSTPCVFSILNPGSRAKAMPGKEQCCFCDPKLLSNMQMKKNRDHLIQAYRKLDLERQAKIQSILPKELQIGDVRARKVQEKWEDVLPMRRRVEGFDDEEEERKAYRTRVLDDRCRAAYKMGVKKDKHPANAAVENTSGLPNASCSDRAINFERWCTDGSWVMCQRCQSMQPRDLTEELLMKQEHDATMLPKKNCAYCRKYNTTPPPRPQDVPLPLRGLPPKVIDALRPIEVDTGPEIRAHYGKHMRKGTATGYRQHTGMIRFHWKKRTVRRQIEKLDRRNREIAEEAYKYLKKNDDSEYYEIVRLHNAFLRNEHKPSKLARKRRLDFIESVGIECAIWPHLFWRTDMCLTHIRSTDARRMKRKRKQQQKKGTHADFHTSSSDGEDDCAVEGEERHSIKRTYRALIMSPLLGYGSYELLHFAYDLAMWTALGAAKNVGADKIPIRIMLKKFPFTSMYWKSVHQALIDLVRQIGPPKVFFTLAPYEWTFPYHKWILHDMAELLRSRIYLPYGESLHQAHVMIQTVRGLIAGKQGGTWKKQSLCANNADGDPVWIHYFTRLEFQDGTRKLPTQGYHGSGRPHIHVLLWLESIRDIPMDKIACATTRGQTEDMKRYIRGAQDDNKLDSKWPVSKEPNHWDEEKQTYVLEHHQSDKNKGRRAFFTEIMDGMKCHQDIQYADGYGALQKYVVGYLSKTNDAATDDMQDDSLQANALALNILSRYKPMEPEMLLQMCQQRMRQWDVGTVHRGRKEALIPLPNAEPARIPEFVRHYQNSGFAGSISRGDRIPLLEFLRKTNKDGGISDWLQALHKKDNSGVSLNNFARNYRMRGEQIVSAAVYNRYNDNFFGQWLVLNVPFENIQDLMKEEITECVPEDIMFFANALKTENEDGCFWRTERRVRREMAQEGQADKDIDSFWKMVQAHTTLVDDYIKGNLYIPRGKVPLGDVILADGEGRKDLPDDEGVELDKRQKRLEAHVLEACVRSAEIKTLADSKKETNRLDELMKTARGSKAAICTGPPGTGKTTAIFSCIKEVLKNNGKVLFALPTAQLASRMRDKYKNQRRNVVIDTCAAAFELLGNGVTELPTLSDFDLIVVDELSLIAKNHFERIIKLWNHVDRVPALVFLGDDFQMAGYGERPWVSPLWKSACDEYKLHRAYRCKDPHFWSMLTQIRRDLPSPELVAEFCKRKAWLGSPNVKQVRKVLEKHPDTTIMTCTRKGASRINFLATRAYFAKEKPLAWVDGDYESNHRNYDGDELKPIDKLTASNMPIYKGMKIYLTQNVRKQADFVNGMRCTIEEYCQRSQSIRVLTETKKRIMIFRWTDPDRKFPAHYPIRPGYCSTIMKFQGATLKHATIYIDCPGIKGAAYTALSRLATREDYLLGGYLKPEHFTPADGRKR